MSHLIPLQQHLTRLGVCCGASWKTTLKEAAARLGALEKTGDVDWERGLSLGLEIRRMFGGMCTLNDLPFDEIGLQRKADLRDSLDLWLRECWRRTGRVVREIPLRERFLIGERVRLLQGHAVALADGGRPVPAPLSEIAYTVECIEANDIDEMPMYYICSQSSHRIVRHEALAHE